MRTPPTPKLPAFIEAKKSRLLDDERGPEIRLTIPVSREVHEAFTRIGQATRMPVGRAMGEWLQDTVDAAQFMAETLEKARSAPKLVAQELHAYALGIGDEARDLVERMKAGRRPEGALLAGKQPAAARSTPPSNTGVTTTKNKNRKGGTDAQQNVR
jgi:hypothetical protein